jgi:hypothetical protein
MAWQMGGDGHWVREAPDAVVARLNPQLSSE